MENVSIPIFYDLQDTQVINYGLNPPLGYMKTDIPNERYCFENATGIISHSMEPQYVKKAYHVKSSPRFHFFPNYCDSDYFVKSPEKKGDEIHLVYAGSVHGKHRDFGHFGTLQFHEKIEELSAQGIHFHIYPGPLQYKAQYEDYYKIADQNPFFHLHESVHQKNLIEELAKYDFGFLPFFDGENSRQNEKRRYATSLKLFNYIEAGLPVIISKDLWFQCWMLKRYAEGIIISRSDIPKLKVIINNFDTEKTRKAIREKRTQISLDNKIKRLIEWYDITGIGS